MKRIILIIFFICLLPLPVFSAPFLVCDANADVDWYVVEVDGVELPGVLDAEADGSLRFDLASITVGGHSIRILAGNMWGQSVYSELFPFAKTLPVVPENLRLIAG